MLFLGKFQRALPPAYLPPQYKRTSRSVWLLRASNHLAVEISNPLLVLPSPLETSANRGDVFEPRAILADPNFAEPSIKPFRSPYKLLTNRESPIPTELPVQIHCRASVVGYLLTSWIVSFQTHPVGIILSSATTDCR